MLLPLTPIHEAWGSEVEDQQQQPPAKIQYADNKYAKFKIKPHSPTELDVNLTDKDIIELLYPKTRKERTDIVTHALKKMIAGFGTSYQGSPTIEEEEPEFVGNSSEENIFENFVQKRQPDVHVILILVLLLVAFIDKLVSCIK